MSTNPTIFHNNLSKTYTLTATASTSGFPVSNLTTDDPKRLWKTANVASSVYVTFTGSVQKNIQGIFLFGTNLTDYYRHPGELLDCELTNDNFATKTVINMSTIVQKRRQVNWLTGVVEEYDYTLNYCYPNANFQTFRIRILLNNSLIGEPYFSIGEVFVSGTKTETLNFNSNFEAGNITRATEIRNQFETVFVVNQSQKFVANLDFSFLTNTSAKIIENITMESRCVLFPDTFNSSTQLADGDCYYGTIIQGSPKLNIVNYRGSLNDKVVSIVFEEAI